MFFKVLNNLISNAQKFTKKGNVNLKLSMGMSNDYLQALKYHSDVVRIGSLIFSG